MKYRCEVDISFNEEDDAVAFMNLMQEIKDRIYSGTGNDGIANIKKLRYHECFHDENPPKQCGDYINFDLRKAEKEDVKNKGGKKINASDLLKPKGA